jgi:hypothetical protein
MSVQRSPERRGGAGRGLGVLGIIVAFLVLVVVVALVAGLAGPLLGVGNNTGPDPQVGPGATPATVTPAPDTTPTPETEPTPTAQPDNEPTPPPLQTPAVDFGEVAAEGWVDLNLPGGELAQTWYTFQVDTRTRNITLFFALYSETGARTSTVMVSEYTQGQRLTNAEVTLYHLDGPERVILFDGPAGNVTETQELSFRTLVPSVFSPAVRSSLVYYQAALEDATGDTRAELDRDLTGVLARDRVVFQRSDPSTVDRALMEIELLANQIEDRRR